MGEGAGPTKTEWRRLQAGGEQPGGQEHADEGEAPSRAAEVAQRLGGGRSGEEPRTSLDDGPELPAEWRGSGGSQTVKTGGKYPPDMRADGEAEPEGRVRAGCQIEPMPPDRAGALERVELGEEASSVLVGVVGRYMTLAAPDGRILRQISIAEATKTHVRIPRVDSRPQSATPEAPGG